MVPQGLISVLLILANIVLDYAQESKIIPVFVRRNNSRRCRPTPPDIYGPYYEPRTKRLTQYCTGDKDSYYNHTLTVHGHVYADDCRTGIPNTKIEVWQADVDGRYHWTDCRGYIMTDRNGYYEFTTVNPGRYTIDRAHRDTRPRHIHYKVHGGREFMGVVTQMYFRGDPFLGNDDPCRICSSERNELITRPSLYCRKGVCMKTVKFDIVLERKPRGRESPTEMFNVIKV